MIPLSELQDAAFERIPTDAERYASDDHAVTIFVQEALFSLRVAHEQEAESIARRAEMTAETPEDIILFPHELTELRLRAAYHGAGLATEPDHTIPDRIHYHLSDNLENYRPKIEYEQVLSPWAYRFKPDMLRTVLLHDYSIAASDYADGYLKRISLETDPEEYTEEFGIPESIYGYNSENLEPGDFLEEAFLSFKPGVDAEEIVYSAFLRAGYSPPFDWQWSLDMQRVVQDMIDGDDRIE